MFGRSTQYSILCCVRWWILSLHHEFSGTWYVVGLLLLAVPVIIHLFSFRRFKNGLFSDIRFLKQVREESATRNRLETMVDTGCQIAGRFLSCHGRFVQPFLPGAEKAVTGSSHAVSVYVDNSFSMEAEHDGLSLLEAARQQAWPW